MWFSSGGQPSEERAMSPSDRKAAQFDRELRLIASVLPRAAFGPHTYRVARGLDALSRHRRASNIETVTVGASSVRLHHPATDSGGQHPGLVWIHGGGYVVGCAAQDDALCRAAAAHLGAFIAAVDYRLAPENPFPAALEDCYDALTWLTRRDDVDKSRVAVGGASAGGGLAAALALLARDRNEITPVLQLLSYPMLDDRTAARTDIDERHFRLWNNKANRFGWQSYLGKMADGAKVSGLAAPSRHTNLTGLPAAWIGVGSLDLFHDENLAYADRLRTASVRCEVEVVPGAFHGFDSICPNAKITRRFRDAQLRALADAFDIDALERAEDNDAH
jgi:acetyl esterase/lipase